MSARPRLSPEESDSCATALSRKSTRYAADGFTILELLIVVAIIALLISIVLPSVARARESARSVVCCSNLSEWSRAMMMYTQQHRDFLPYEDRGDENLGMCAGSTPCSGRPHNDRPSACARVDGLPERSEA